MPSLAERLRRKLAMLRTLPVSAEGRRFRRRLLANLHECTWEPHPDYSVFTQHDYTHYTSRRDHFLHKYRCFYAISQTIAPRRIIELGTHAASGADAYLSATPRAEYTGIDLFDEDQYVSAYSGLPWKPREVATALLEARGFRHVLIQANLRAMSSLPVEADMVVVDAAHDMSNAYADLQLALTAKPEWIVLDDFFTPDVRAAVWRFLREDLCKRVAFTAPVDHFNGGLVIKLSSKAS